MNWFGTIGSRSRNSWGSLNLKSDNFSLPELAAENLNDFCRPLANCLENEWAHAIGSDGKPLVWRTAEQNNWHDVLLDIATLKVDFRTKFEFSSGESGKGKDWRPQPSVEKRHVISYPVTHHNVEGLRREARLANQIRFKVEKTAGGQFRAVIVHLPCKAPNDGFVDKLDRQNQTRFRDYEKSVWPVIHKILDDKASRQKCGERNE
jgi:CRISPR-associated protein Cmr1